MKRNGVWSIIVYIDNNTDFHALSDRVNGFHVEVIERRLNQMNLTVEQKVIINIIEDLKSREVNGIIK